jgi:hypothetical protein
LYWLEVFGLEDQFEVVPEVLDPKKSAGILTFEKPELATSVKYCSCIIGAQLPSVGALKVLPIFNPLPIDSTTSQEDIWVKLTLVPKK